MRETEFASYADESKPYVASDSVNDVIRILENDSIRLFKWLSDIKMKAKKYRWHLIFNNNENVSIKNDDIEVEGRGCERLLGTKLDSKFNFMHNLNGIIKKASLKKDVLSRITPYLTQILLKEGYW